jgi:hypothetical protein
MHAVSPGRAAKTSHGVLERVRMLARHDIDVTVTRNLDGRRNREILLPSTA